MAAKDVEHLKEHFLSCDICMEIYEDPITLPCGHTFCRKCYIRYCQENKEATRNKSLQCPTCKQCDEVQNPGKKVRGRWNVANWVKPLKPSFIIRGLLDEFVSSVGNSEGTTVTTDRRTLSRNEVKAFCLKHKLDSNCYCKKCKVCVCSECVVENHMKCGDVVKIEAMKPEMKFTLDRNLQTLSQQTKQTEQCMGKIEHQMTNLRKMESKVREDIKMTSESAIKLIREWERKKLDELSSVTEKRFEQLSAQLKTVETDLHTFRQYSEFISRSLRGENERDMIKMFETCQSGEMFTKSDDGAHLASTQFVEMEFEKCFSYSDLKKHLHLGNLKVKKINDSSVDLNAEKTRELTVYPLDAIDLKIDLDCFQHLSDVCVIEVDGVEVMLAILYSIDGSCLKSFSVKNNKPRVTELQLSVGSSCLTHLSSNRVAVNMYFLDCSGSTIVMVNVTPDLTIQSAIKTQKKYLGLTSLDENTLAAGCESTPCVDILDLRGRVKKTISPGGSLIQRPNHLSRTQEGNILVSDCGSRSVVCLTQGGDVVFTYSPTGDRTLSFSRGITTTATGDILVTDSFNDKVIQLTGAGEYVRDLLTSQDEIKGPMAICVHNDKLYLTQFEIDTVRVYKLQ